MGLFTRTNSNKNIKSTLILDPKGVHSIGGRPAESLHIPSLESSPVVYFGCIKKGEPALKVLDFDLNLLCPIFLNLYEPVFLDYSDPEKPILIRNNVQTDFSQYFTDIPNTTKIEYRALKFNFDQSKDPNWIYENGFGSTGEPNWIQDNAWPKCPRSGKKMTFLFQLSDIDGCATILGQEILDKEYIDPYLHFGHGYLYVFLEPKSRIVAYVNQIT